MPWPIHPLPLTNLTMLMAQLRWPGSGGFLSSRRKSNLFEAPGREHRRFSKIWLYI
ncbi:hypothetical protein SCLCIDRAFT_1211902, partial [Scleroderma citrinum Foug A]